MRTVTAFDRFMAIACGQRIIMPHKGVVGYLWRGVVHTVRTS